MSRVQIIPVTVNGQSAYELQINVVGYIPASETINFYYGYFNQTGKFIKGGEGNIVNSNLYIASADDTTLKNALEAAVGAVTSWRLTMYQIRSNRYHFEYVQGGAGKRTTISASILPSLVDGSIINAVITALGLSLNTTAPVNLMTFALSAVGFPSLQRSAVLSFVSSADTKGYYNKLIRLQIMLGDSIAHKLYNLLDPENLDESFRGTYTGTVTSISKGLQLAASHGGIVDFHLVFSQISNVPYFGRGTYMQNEPGRIVYGGADSYYTNTYYDGDGKSYPDMGAISSGTLIAAGKKGHWNVQRIDVNNVQERNEGTLLFTESQLHLSTGDDTDKLAVGFRDGTTAGQISISYAHLLMTNTEQNDLNTDLQTLVTALGIAV